MMPPFRLAHLSPEQMSSVERLEHDLHLTLIAWEPEAGAETGPSATAATQDQERDPILDALVDDYRTFDPQSR